MERKLLDTIKSPDDLKCLSVSQLTELCAQIRARLIDVISKNGGHLASNLGVVELTVALHTVFNSPDDVIIFDVGHQCYTHKLLTGRNGRFDDIRKFGGISGFPKPFESADDPVTCGHAGNALSAALGIARAKKLNGEPGKVIAVVGDGSFANGMVYEAINNLNSREDDNLVVVLNDNSMSISKTVGSIANYLMRLRIKSGYSTFKVAVRTFIEHIPLVGTAFVRATINAKRKFRRSLYHGTIFEEFGFNYIGTVDGHDLSALLELFENIKLMREPVLFHVKTKKGKGYSLAENNPGAYHGVSGFKLEVDNPDISLADSFSNKFGLVLCEAAANDERICAVTAAMKYATGLHYFSKLYPRRFFDVGIAEEHAVAFCAGLAARGKKPVFAVYSTFLQRTYDQLIHDVVLNNADILFAVDRAGLTGSDGETHQGIFDAAFLSQLNNFIVASPVNYDELRYWTEHLLRHRGPAAVRYPRGAQDERLTQYKCSGEKFDLLTDGAEHGALLVSYGRIVAEVFDAAKKLADSGESVDILKLNVISPIDPAAVAAAAAYERVLFVEEGIAAGGIGEHFAAQLSAADYRGRFRLLAIAETAVPHMSVSQATKRLGLDAEGIVKRYMWDFCDEKKA